MNLKNWNRDRPIDITDLKTYLTILRTITIPAFVYKTLNYITFSTFLVYILLPRALL
jgi:hypothetical protein